jgi:hypothetical protein
MNESIPTTIQETQWSWSRVDTTWSPRVIQEAVGHEVGWTLEVAFGHFFSQSDNDRYAPGYIENDRYI